MQAVNSRLTIRNEPRVIQAECAGPLTSGRARAVGRIGGFVGREDRAALARLGQKLGSDAQLLSPPSTNLVVDWDACWLDDRPIERLDQWLSVLREDRLAEVEGAFALAWLSEAGTLLLARDALGERTLFCSVLPDGLIFASRIHALLASGAIERRLHLPAVATYLSYAYLPGRETLVENVFELLPGEVIEYRDGAIHRSCLWPIPEEPSAWRAEDNLRDDLRTRLEAAVRRRLPAGESVGAFLSGGLDSSLVVALARQLHDAPVETYSVSFGAGYANELFFSSLVAEHCQTNHRIVELAPAVVRRYLDESVALLSDPIGDPLTVPNALLFREVSQDVRVVLNGEGGDPSFGGPKNLPMILAELYGADDNDGDRYWRERSYLRAHLKCYDDLDKLFLPDVRDAIATARLEERLSEALSDPRWRSFVARLQAVNVSFKGGHHILPKVDALSFPFGVVPRSPLFDRAVVELSFAIPPQGKLRGSVEKYLLKEAVRDLLPETIIRRPKSGMLVPVEAWFQGPLLPEARQRLLDGLTPYRLFQRDYLERLLDGRLGGLRPRHGAKIWLFVTLEAWLRTVFAA